MSTAKRQIEEKKAKSKGERRFGKQRSTPEVADWGSVPASVLSAVIAKVALKGGALRFGYTSDGGAYALGVYGDGATPYTEYWRPGDDVEGALKELEQVFDDM